MYVYCTYVIFILGLLSRDYWVGIIEYWFKSTDYKVGVIE